MKTNKRCIAVGVNISAINMLYAEEGEYNIWKQKAHIQTVGRFQFLYI